MKEQLQTLIEQKISKWQRDGIYENIYAISLYVFNQEDDPRRPAAVLGYNTEQQVWKSIPLASDEQEARWNYAFWLQNEELCWGLGDTAEAVRRWIAELDPKEEAEIDGAFRRMLTEAVREIHASGLLRSNCGRELPILIHGLEYDRETARQNLEANGETLDRDFLVFCGLEQSVPDTGYRDIPGKPLKGQKEQNPEKEPASTPHYGLFHMSDIPRKFSCGEKKADMRHVIAFILILIFVLSTMGIYPAVRNDLGRAPDLEEIGQGGQSTAGGGGASGSIETEGKPTASGSREEDVTALEPIWIKEPDSEQNIAVAVSENEPDAVSEDEEQPAMPWQIYIHPDVPYPLVEVLEQYELAMNMGVVGEDLYYGTVEDKLEKLGIAGPYYIDYEMYGSWCTTVKEGEDRTICYSLRDLTGDGIPELIMGNGNSESVCIRVIYEYTVQGDIRVMDSSAYYDMTLYEGDILEYVSGGVAYTVTYWQFSQKRQDWRIVESLGIEWDYENAKEVGPYRQIITDGEYAEKEMISEEEFGRIRAQYTQRKMELQWYSLTSPGWHILTASNELYDMYLEGISTDLWLAKKDVRQLYFSIYDKEGALVQELVESSPYLYYAPDPYYEGNFYFEDMNFDGTSDLMLLGVNINHPQWIVYLWREDEGVFREELDARGEEVAFGYYFIEEEKEYIDETVSDGSGYTIYRTRYDRERGYYLVGALYVYFGDEEGTQDEEEERLREYFYEDGIYQGCTDVISEEEVSEIWSDLWE